MPRYTFEFAKEIDKTFTRLAEEKGTTKADILRRALASYAYLEKETRDENRKVSITDSGDHVLKDVVLP